MAVQSLQQLNLDSSQENKFISFFKNLPEKPPTTVLIFERGEFYTCHGEDALLVSKVLFNTTSAVKRLGKEGAESLESISLSRSHFERLARELLLVRNYRIEVYTNSSKNSSSPKWEVEYFASPGNIGQFDDVLFGNTGSDLVPGTELLAIKLGKDSSGQRIIGVAVADLGKRNFRVGEFPDDGHLANLQTLAVQLSPRELLVLPVDKGEVSLVLEKSTRILITVCKKSDFNGGRDSGFIQDLNRLLHFEEGQKPAADTLPELNLVHASDCLAGLINYLELSKDSSNHGHFHLERLEFTRFLHLDSAALGALTLFPPFTEGAPTRASPTNSVLGLLDRCRTQPGHRLITQWLKQPLRDTRSLAERHEAVSTFVSSQLIRQDIQDEYLKKMPDLEALARRLMRSKANLQDCYRIYQAVKRLPQLVENLESLDNSTIRDMFVKSFKDHLEDMKRYEEMIMSTLDLDLIDQGGSGAEFMVKPDFDEDLKELRAQMNKLEEKLKKESDRTCSETGLALKLENAPQLGYYMRITLKSDKDLSSYKKFTIIDTNKNGIRFRSPNLESLNDEYCSARDSYLEMQKKIVDEILNIASGYANSLNQISDLMAQVDVLASFAEVACNAPIPYIKPEMLESGEDLELLELRHPCVELMPGMSFIANDCHISHKNNLQLITGPNMGGKSTYLRSVGVAVLMAHIGSFVPCREARIPLTDGILVRVGASDCLSKGISTFMNEMIETTSILRSASRNSLVLVDELGRGTSTYEGCGLAYAIAEHLANDIGAYTIFATHFHELTRLPETAPSVKNFHVTALVRPEDERLTLLYQLKPGPSLQSFGVHVSSMAGFKSKTVENAKRKQEELEVYQGLDLESKIVEEGQQRIAVFLNQCKKLKSSQDNIDLKNELEKLKNEMISEGNEYINALIS